MEKISIGYVRVSTDEQANNGYSIGAQRNLIGEKFESLGVTDYRVYIDDGVSGKSINRKELKKVLRLIESGEVEKFIIYKLDRLTRNLSDLIFLLETCINNEVQLISIYEELNLDTAMGRLYVYIIGVFAQFEREQVSERTLTGLREKARRKQYPRRGAPFGFKKDKDHRLIPIKKEQKALKKLFEMYAIEYKTEKEINAELNKWNIRNFKNIYDLLSATIYQGYIEIPKKSGIKFNMCEPVFSIEDIEILEKRKKVNVQRYGYKHDYKYRNKIRVDGVPSKHTISKGNTYYYRPGKYVAEKEIDSFLMRVSKKQQYDNGRLLEEVLIEATKLLLSGDITKEEFDLQYDKINDEYIQTIEFDFINVIFENDDKIFILN